MSPDPAAVRAAAAAWLYVPAGTAEVVTEEFRVLAYPPTWANPTQAARIASDRPAPALVRDVLAAAESLGRDEVWFWVEPGTRPPGLVEELLARGGVLDEQLAVLARSVVDLPDLAVPNDVEVRLAGELDDLRAVDRIDVEVFGGSPSTDEQLLTVRSGPGSVFVAHRAGQAVGSSGLSVVDGVLRLWGGAVLPEARGAGVYRALLAHRLVEGVRAGATLALVKGRLATSAPTLLRAGFEQYGEERSFRLAVSR